MDQLTRHRKINQPGEITAEMHAFQRLGNLTAFVVVCDRFGNISNEIHFMVHVNAQPLERLVVNTSSDQTDAPGSKTLSLRDAVTMADHYLGPVAISFDSKVFAKRQTIELKQSDLQITNVFGNVSIVGPSAGVVFSGGGTVDILVVQADVNASLMNLTISDGSSKVRGALTNFGSLTVANCTVSGNSGMVSGAGINNAGSLDLVNSTIANNTTAYSAYSQVPSGLGGGLYNSGDATLADVTITGNSAYNGGGIDNVGTLTIANSIVAGNKLDRGLTGPDVTGVVLSKGHNLVGEIDGSDGWTSSDYTGTVSKRLNPHLGALQDNGGPTPTVVPLQGSMAINDGSIALLPAGVTTDQRGRARVQRGKIDIGSVET